MSRQFSRNRIPFDDDTQPASKEELNKLTHALAGEPHPTNRPAYFAGQYTPPANMNLAQHLAEYHLPPSLEPFVLQLIRIMKSQGMAAALSTLHNGPTMEKQQTQSVIALLEAIHKTSHD